MGRGWSTVGKTSHEVTETVLAEARRGAGAVPPCRRFTAILEAAAVTPMSFAEVMVLAAGEYPQWRPSEQLALAEQAVWEMLHHGQLALIRGGETVPAADWQPILLSWPTWADDGASGCGSVPAADRAARSGHHFGDHPLALGLGGEQEAAHPQQALDVVDVVVEVGDEQQRPVAELGAEPCDVAGVAARQHVVVAEVLGHPVGQAAGQLIARARPADRRARRRRAGRGGRG